MPFQRSSLKHPPLPPTEKEAEEFEYVSETPCTLSSSSSTSHPPSLPPPSSFHPSSSLMLKLASIYMVLGFSVVAGNIIIPFSPYWCEECFDATNVGLESGSLVGSFNFAVAVSAPFFGYWSDRKGRKPFMLFGLLSLAVFTLIGGFAPNYWVAFASRVLAGLCDANQSVTFAAIGAVTTDKAMKPLAFGYAALAAQMARIFGAVIGGFLWGVGNEEVLRRMFGPLLEGEENVCVQVLPPMMVAAGLCVIGAGCVWFVYVDEGGEGKGEEGGEGKEMEMKEMLELEEGGRGAGAGEGEGEKETGTNKKEEGKQGPVFCPLAATTTTCAQQQHLKFLSKAHAATTSTTTPTHTHTHPTPTAPPTFYQGLLFIGQNRLLVELITVYFTTNLLNNALLQAISLIAEDHVHGYGIQASSSGLITMSFGLWCIFFNLFVFKRLVRTYGPKRATCVGLVLISVGVVCLPALALLPSHELQHAMLWPGLGGAVVVSASGFMLINSIVASFISTHAGGRAMQGSVQGVSRMFASLGRGLGPILIGSAYQYSTAARKETPFFPFLLLACGYLLCLCVLVRWRRGELEGGEKEGEKEGGEGEEGEEEKEQ